MKTTIYKYILFSVVVILCLSLNKRKPKDPLIGCFANILKTYNTKDYTLKMSLDYNIIVSKRTIAIVLNGLADYKDKRAIISRTVNYDYTISNNILKIEYINSDISKFDTAQEGIFEKYLPPVWTINYVNITKIKDDKFLVYDNHAPIFVCKMNIIKDDISQK